VPLQACCLLTSRGALTSYLFGTGYLERIPRYQLYALPGAVVVRASGTLVNPGAGCGSRWRLYLYIAGGCRTPRNGLPPVMVARLLLRSAAINLTKEGRVEGA